MTKFAAALEQLHCKQITLDEFFGKTCRTWEFQAMKLDGMYPTAASDREDILQDMMVDFWLYQRQEHAGQVACTTVAIKAPRASAQARRCTLRGPGVRADQRGHMYAEFEDDGALARTEPVSMVRRDARRLSRTELELAVVEAVEECRSVEEMTGRLGVSRFTVQKTLQVLRQRAQRQAA